MELNLKDLHQRKRHSRWTD